MLTKNAPDLKYSDVTDERWYLRRREFLRLGVGVAGAAAGGALIACGSDSLDAAVNLAVPANAAGAAKASALARARRRNMDELLCGEGVIEALSTQNRP